MTIQVTRGSAVAGNIAEADTFCLQHQPGGMVVAGEVGGRQLRHSLRPQSSASDVKKASN